MQGRASKAEAAAERILGGDEGAATTVPTGFKKQRSLKAVEDICVYNSLA